MKLKSLMVAAVMLAFAGSTMAATAPAKKHHAHKKVHMVKKHHKVKHKKSAAM